MNQLFQFRAAFFPFSRHAPLIDHGHGHWITNYRVCWNKRSERLIFRNNKKTFQKSTKAHRFCVLPPLKNHPSKLIGFVYSPLWKITHQSPSVLCTPLFEKSPIKILGHGHWIFRPLSFPTCSNWPAAVVRYVITGIEGNSAAAWLIIPCSLRYIFAQCDLWESGARIAWLISRAFGDRLAWTIITSLSFPPGKSKSHRKLRVKHVLRYCRSGMQRAGYCFSCP